MLEERYFVLAIEGGLGDCGFSHWNYDCSFLAMVNNSSGYFSCNRIRGLLPSTFPFCDTVAFTYNSCIQCFTCSGSQWNPSTTMDAE